jgi:hypothetical protein
MGRTRNRNEIASETAQNRQIFSACGGLASGGACGGLKPFSL